MAFNYKLFLDWAEGQYQEMLPYQVDMFNQKSMGCLNLTGGNFSGGTMTNTFWPLVSNMVKKRNLFDKTGLKTNVEITNDQESMVKIAAGTDRFITRPSDAQYIQMGEKVAGIHYGNAMAEYMVKDMVDTSILILLTCIGKEGSTLTKDITGDTPDTLNLRALNRTSGLFGDAASQIRCWITHSTTFTDLIDNNLQNSEVLFKFGDVMIRTDVSGKPFIVTDAPWLKSDDATPVYSTLGLVPGAVTVEGPNDYLSDAQRYNETNNIYDAFTSQWTYNVRVKGYSWNAGSNTVASPDDAALGSAANWLKVRASHKLLPGVILKTN